MPKRKIPLNSEVLRTRIAYIEDSLRSLERFKGMPFEEFHANPDHFRIAFYDLHRSLEAMIDIGTHILSRISGARPTAYEDIPRLLEKYRIIPSAQQSLVKMAGYRNRMVHFYGEITERELYSIIQEQLGDFSAFIGFIERILKDPGKFGLEVQ